MGCVDPRVTDCRCSTRRVCSSSYQRARISFEFHVCVTWMRIPGTALELPDSSEQKTRLVVRDDPPLHVERVEHPSKPRLRAVTHRYDAVAGPRIAQYECYRGFP